MVERTDKQTFLNKQPIFFSDFLTNFNKHPSTGALGRVTNSNSLKQALKNIVLTNFGERLYQPNLGGNVSGALFEQMDGFTINLLSNSIKSTIFNNEPRVQSLNVNIIPDINNNLYNVTIAFIEQNTRVTESFDLVLIRNR